MEPLTAAQGNVLRFILQHISEEHRPPTLQEIASACGFQGPAGAACHLKPLAKKRFIDRTKGRACGIKPLPVAWAWLRAQQVAAVEAG